MSSEGVMADIEKFQYKVRAGEGDKPVIEVDYQGRKKAFAPEEISAMVLSKMKEIAEDLDLDETLEFVRSQLTAFPPAREMDWAASHQADADHRCAPPAPCLGLCSHRVAVVAVGR